MRIFVECKSAAVAGDIADRMLSALNGLGLAASAPPKPYWKTPEYFEFTFSAKPSNEQAFRSVVALCAGGWMHYSDIHEFSSVWNKADEINFLDPLVKWAEVQLHA
jgi:hypothetical protein